MSDVKATLDGMLIPAIGEHAATLAASLDRVGEAHREAADRLGGWIAANHRAGEALPVIVICTGNSRRSILGSTMGNIAAAHAGLPDVRFHSGGTAPSAFNPRTVAALRAIGVEIDPAGEEAPRGEPGTPNPKYRVRWGDGPGMSIVEFSKAYSDPANPRAGFAALMVCDEADGACPAVQGAALRVPMPFRDPKEADDSGSEAATYADRRDEIGRVMMAALVRASRLMRGEPGA
jgi:arsenate reductase